MAQAVKCPICNELIDAGQNVCPRCGFKLIGKTQTFKPVKGKSDDVDLCSSGVLPALEVIKGPYAGESFILGQGSFTLGRDPVCDIFLSNMTVSRHHATITIENGNAYIEDAGSLNGTWVDGKIVDSANLVAGTRIQIGTFEMVFRNVPKQA